MTYVLLERGIFLSFFVSVFISCVSNPARVLEFSVVLLSFEEIRGEGVMGYVFTSQEA